MRDMTTSPMMLRLMGLAAFSSMASMRVCDPMLIALSHEFQATTGDASAVIARSEERRVGKECRL